MIVSIILATRDRPAWLPIAVESVVAQDDDRWELVIYDNGNEPAVPLWPIEMPDERVRYVYGDASGPADAYQKALDLATGDIVLPLADDDTLEPHAVRTIIENMEANPAVQWGYAQTAFTQDKAVRFIIGGPWSLERLRQDYCLGGAVFWRRQLTDRLGGFDSAYDGAADYDLYLRFGEDSEPVFVEQVLYRYTDHPGTDSNVRSANQRAMAAKIRARAPRRRVAVVTPWVGHHELIPFYAQTVERADQVIIVDNGGGPSGELLSPAPSLIVTPDEPLGFAASNNYGAAFLDETIDVVVFLNNDVHAAPEWLDRVRADVQEDGLYGPSIGRQTLKGTSIPYVEGWCVAATAETWEKLGPWDAERFPLAYWEDVELALRATQRGIDLRRAPWKIRHLGGTTTSHTPGVQAAVNEGQRVVEQILEEMMAWRF